MLQFDNKKQIKAIQSKTQFTEEWLEQSWWGKQQ